MDLDKILIGIAGVIVCFVCLTWSSIQQEVSLLMQEEIKPVAESLQSHYFTPLSLQEQAVWHRRFADALEDEQAKVERSWIASHFIDYKDQIAAEKRQVNELEGTGEEEITFMTKTLHTVVSAPLFTKAELLQIGSLIDEYFNEETQGALFMIEVDEGKRQIVLQPLLSGLSGDFSSFVKRVSSEVFRGESVLLVVLSHEHPDDLQFYES